MEIIIVGAGKVGQALCEELATNHNIVIVDVNSRLVDSLMDQYDITGLVGNGAMLETQREAGVENADIFIAATDSDEVNMIAAALAKHMGAKHIIARVRNTEYAMQLDFMKHTLGISLIVNPELSAAMDISRSIRYASALSMETLAGNRVALVELEVLSNSDLDQLSLSDFRMKYGSVLVCIIKRDDDVFIPSGQNVLKSGDRIFVAGMPKDMSKFTKRIGGGQHDVENVFVVGAGRITHYLLKLLEHTRMNVKVIDIDLERCELISEKYPYAQIIHDDGTNTDVLDEQCIGDYDAFVSLTGVDEENLIMSLYANQNNVPKVITKLNRKNLLKVIDKRNLKKIVTPRYLVASEIAQFVRSRANAEGSNVEALYRVADNEVEVLQFKVCPKCTIINQPLAQLNLKQGLLIAYIIRDNKIIFPSGQDELHVGDKVVVMTTHKEFTDLENILEK